MQKVKNIIIGFGKAGKTLASYLAKKGEETVLIEKSPKMYGGTCINVACIPSKYLAQFADQRELSPKSNEDFYKEAIEEKKNLIEKLNKANYDKVSNSGVEVIDGLASFIDDHTVKIRGEKTDRVISAERIFINTGARPLVPDLSGLEIKGNIHTSQSLMDLEKLPKKMVILGSGFIGLEFATSYAKFGSRVTILNRSDKILKNEDDDLAESISKSIKDLGIEIKLNANLKKVSQDENTVTITYEIDGEVKNIDADILLVATGRRPNTEELNLNNAGVETDQRGFIKTNKYLQTNKDHIFALGDVKGGPQFTYISLDDYRIIKSFLEDGGKYNLENRQVIPTSTFLHPTFSKVGLTEKQALEKGYDIKVNSIPVSSIPKAKILGNQTGIYKVIVDKKTEKILGASLFGKDAHEVINIITTAMIGGQKYTDLAKQIFTHPTMAEALNDLFDF